MSDTCAAQCTIVSTETITDAPVETTVVTTETITDVPTYFPTIVQPSFSPIPAPEDGESTEIIIETTFTVAGVTQSNFESLKTALTEVFANYFGVAVSKVALTFASSRRSLSGEGEILVAITAADQAEMSTFVNDIRANDFADEINDEIQAAVVEHPELSGIEVTEVSAPVLVTTTTTSPITTTAGGSSTLYAFFALILSAIVF